MNKKLIFLFIFIVIIILARLFSVAEWINLNQLKIHRDYLQHLVEQHYLLAVLCYIGLYILVVSFSLPIGAILTVAGGFLFGITSGVIYANIGATGGATIAFLLVRYFIGGTLQQKYAIQLARFNKSIVLYGSNYLLAIRFIVIIPFFLVNILAGLTNIAIWTFIWTTAVGVLPGSFIYAFAGKQLGSVERVHDIFSFHMFLALLFLALFALLPIIFSYLRKRSQRSRNR
ncbi:MAG: VTT domain-containing protein [Candidatus Babeliales bacterium]|jgi:uncharacterized membrane protein YdjX (TVP38/TMEM64 family)